MCKQVPGAEGGGLEEGVKDVGGLWCTGENAHHMCGHLVEQGGGGALHRGMSSCIHHSGTQASLNLSKYQTLSEEQTAKLQEVLENRMVDTWYVLGYMKVRMSLGCLFLALLCDISSRLASVSMLACRLLRLQ